MVRAPQIMDANGHTNGKNNAVQNGCKLTSTLSQKELDLVDQLRSAVQSQADTKPLQQFLSTSTLVRYLRARSWQLQRASKMLLATLKWRKEYKPEAITWDEVAPEAETGKQFLLRDKAGNVARDCAGRPVLVLRPRNENTKTWERQMRYVIYNLEVTSWHADQGGNTSTGMTWLVDFVGYGMRNAPPIKSALTTLNVLQNHYPERLGAAIAYLPPTIFTLTWKAIHPFMDTATKEKIHFIDNEQKAREALGQLLDLTNVEKCMSGDSDYVFDFKEYSKFRRSSDAIRQQELN